MVLTNHSRPGGSKSHIYRHRPGGRRRHSLAPSARSPPCERRARVWGPAQSPDLHSPHLPLGPGACQLVSGRPRQRPDPGRPPQGPPLPTLVLINQGTRCPTPGLGHPGVRMRVGLGPHRRGCAAHRGLRCTRVHHVPARLAWRRRSAGNGSVRAEEGEAGLWCPQDPGSHPAPWGGRGGGEGGQAQCIGVEPGCRRPARERGACVGSAGLSPMRRLWPLCEGCREQGPRRGRGSGEEAPGVSWVQEGWAGQGVWPGWRERGARGLPASRLSAVRFLSFLLTIHLPLLSRPLQASPQFETGRQLPPQEALQVGAEASGVRGSRSLPLLHPLGTHRRQELPGPWRSPHRMGSADHDQRGRATPRPPRSLQHTGSQTEKAAGGFSVP